VASAGSFGQVEVVAKAGAGKLASLTVTVGKRVIVVPASWLATLPAMELSGIEVRSERGYGPAPVLYVVLRGARTTLGTDRERRVHLWFESGALTRATITTTDAKGTTRFEERKAP
jgi:hypothetical protein